MTAVDSAVDVIVEGAGRLGALSYLSPDSELAVGDAVLVPFGTVQRRGVVVQASASTGRATREVLRVLGSVCSPADIAAARAMAAWSFTGLGAVAERLLPRTGMGDSPRSAGVVALRHGVPFGLAALGSGASLVLRPPDIPAAVLGARLAAGLAVSGQVLVLCPSVELVDAVLQEFVSGACRLGARAPRGAWSSFRAGLVRVGVATRDGAFLAPADLAAVMVLEEEHPGHVWRSSPYWSARDVALARARQWGCRAVLVSGAPSPAAVAGADLVLPEAGSAGAGWPRVVLVDRSMSPPSDRVVPEELRDLLESPGSGALVLAESRPAARVCSGCGAGWPCGVCAVPGCSHGVDGRCGQCGGAGVRWVGWDAARLGRVLPSVRAVTWSQLPAAPAGGRLVVVFDGDRLFSASLEPDRSAWRVLFRVAESAGPDGCVVVVSSGAPGPLLEAFARGDAVGAAELVADAARSAGLPPFGRSVLLSSGRSAAPPVEGWPGVVLGPRRRGSEWELLVLFSDVDSDAAARMVARARRAGKVRVRVS